MAVELSCLLAPNPGPLTLEGTNTYVVRGSGGAVVVDPGPLHEAHLARVAATGPVDRIVLTHDHPDHADGADRLAELTGAEVCPALLDGQTVVAGEVRLEVLATPGHTSDSVCLLLAERGELLTGDTVLGRGTTVVAHPDGRLADYLASLARLARLPLAAILPGHGPRVEDPAGWVRFYQRHRRERLAQVRRAWAAGARTPGEVVRLVYADVDPLLWAAAELSVAAQLQFLAEQEARPAGRDGLRPAP